MNEGKFTKCFINIHVKDFPVGKMLKCHLWLTGKYTEAEVTELLNNHLEVDRKFRNKYHVAGFQVKYTVLYARTPRDVKLNLIYIIKEIDYKKEVTRISVPPIGGIGQLTIDNNIHSNNKIDLDNVNLKDYTDDELIKLKRRMVEEFFKREHKLTEEEYKFYTENIDIVEISDIKKQFEESKGDKFKIKKNKIREKLFPKGQIA